MYKIPYAILDLPLDSSHHVDPRHVHRPAPRNQHMEYYELEYQTPHVHFGWIHKSIYFCAHFFLLNIFSFNATPCFHDSNKI